jgi:hypothetical protein
MNMVGHNHERPQLVMAKLDPTEQRLHNDRSDLPPAKKQGARVSGVQMPVHPHESFPRSKFRRRQISGGGNTSVQTPRHKQPPSIRIPMRKSAARIHSRNTCKPAPENLTLRSFKVLRSHECERGTHECVRHNHRPACSRSFWPPSVADTTAACMIPLVR